MHEITSAVDGGNKEIILGPGVYQTYGDYDGRGNNGYLLQPNTTLRGSGRGITTVRLMGYDRYGPNFFHVVIVAGRYGMSYHGDTRVVNYPFISVRDLTVDCNARNLFGGMLTGPLSDENRKHSIYGVQLSGGNCSIQNVEVINPHGRASSPPSGYESWWGSGLESFALAIFNTTNAPNLVNNQILNCSVRDCIGDYVSAIILSGCSGIIANNVVTGGAYVAYSAGGTSNVIISNNVAQDCRFGYRSDTGSIQNLTLSGNSFAVQQAAFALKSAQAGDTFSRINLVGNSFSSIGNLSQSGETANGVIDIDTSLASTISGLTVKSNTMSSENSSFSGIYLRSAIAFPDLTLAANTTQLTGSYPSNLPVNSGVSSDTVSATLQRNDPGLVDFRVNNTYPSDGGEMGFSAYAGFRRGGISWKVRPGGGTNWSLSNYSSSTSTLVESIFGNEYGTVCIPGNLTFGTIVGPSVKGGAIAPDGASYGAAGSIYLRNDSANPTLYVKRSVEGTPWGWETVSVPAGTVLDYAGATAPAGWLMCYGQSLLRSDYPQLFAAIGTAFGAVDGTHFNLPDCRGRVTAGRDNMGGTAIGRITTAGCGIDGSSLGMAGGVQANSDVPSHTHLMGGAPLTGVSFNNNATTTGTSLRCVGVNGASTSTAFANTPTQSNAGPSTVTNVQPTIILLKIVKY